MSSLSHPAVTDQRVLDYEDLQIQKVLKSIFSQGRQFSIIAGTEGTSALRFMILVRF